MNKAYAYSTVTDIKDFCISLHTVTMYYHNYFTTLIESDDKAKSLEVYKVDSRDILYRQYADYCDYEYIDALTESYIKMLELEVQYDRKNSHIEDIIDIISNIHSQCVITLSSLENVLEQFKCQKDILDNCKTVVADFFIYATKQRNDYFTTYYTDSEKDKLDLLDSIVYNYCNLFCIIMQYATEEI